MTDSSSANPGLVVDTSEDSRHAIAERLGLPPDIASSVKAAEIVVLPFERWGDEPRPIFAEGAELAFKALQGRGVTVEIAVSEADYREIALRGVILNLGRFICTKVGLPILIRYIQERLAKRKAPGAEARLEILVEQIDGERKSTARLKYQGPAAILPTVLNDAARSLPPGRPLPPDTSGQP